MATFIESRKIERKRWLCLFSDDEGYFLQAAGDDAGVWCEVMPKIRIPDDCSPTGALLDAVDDYNDARK